MRTCRPGTRLEHESDQVRRYLNVDACPEHSPAKVAGREESTGRGYSLGPRTIADSYPRRTT